MKPVIDILEDRISAAMAEATGEKAEWLFDEFARWLPKLIYFLVSVLIIILILRNAGMVLGGRA